jgi:hypothetical protein
MDFLALQLAHLALETLTIMSNATFSNPTVEKMLTWSMTTWEISLLPPFGSPHSPPLVSVSIFN